MLSLDGPRRSSRIRTRRQVSAASPPSSLSCGADRPQSVHSSLPGCDTHTPQLARTKRRRSHFISDLYDLVSAPVNPNSVSQTPRQLRYAKRQRLLTSHPPPPHPVSDALPPIHPLSIRIQEEPAPLSDSLQRAFHRGTPSHSINIPTHSSSSSQQSSSPASPPNHLSPPERPPTPRPHLPPNAVAATPHVVPVVNSVHSLPVSPFTGSEPGNENPQLPTITTLARIPPPVRERKPDAVDTGLWKLACQERIEYLKDVYRELFDAVVHAEARSLYQALSTATVPQPQFEVYTPLTACSRAHLDPDGDIDMDSDEDCSTDSDEDDFEQDSEDSDADMLAQSDLGSNAGALSSYNSVVALDGVATIPLGSPLPSAQAPRLPRLSSIRVCALDGVPEQTGRNGIPFMGRGTPVDPQRRLDWASAEPPSSSSPSFPALRYATAMHAWTSSPPPCAQHFYAPDTGLAFTSTGIPEQSMQEDAGMGVGAGIGAVFAPGSAPPMQMPAPTHLGAGLTMDMDMSTTAGEAHSQPSLSPPPPECLAWLDPTLRTESESPSPREMEVDPAQDAFLTNNFNDNDSFDIIDCSSASGASVGLVPSPTGCAWHATFLECLQSTGCAPFFAPPPPPPSPTEESVLAPFSHPQVTTMPGHGHAAMGIDVSVGLRADAFPEQELTRFVRARLVPGSVTLGHALG